MTAAAENIGGTNVVIGDDGVRREFATAAGHPAPLWMLFMSEFWERFAFYGIRWAMVLYVVAQFYNGSATGEKPASELYGAYLALVYAGAIFGGYVADKLIGHQRSILLGALIMSTGLFMIAIPSEHVFRLGLATIIVGNGLFKPIISTLVGKLYAQGDERRDSGFTIFYMGINLGALVSPLITQYLAKKVFGIDNMPAYKVVFIASGVGMLLSLVWFWFGRRQLQGIGLPQAGGSGVRNVLIVLALGVLVGVPLFYFLLTIDATYLQVILMLLLVGPAIMLVIEGVREGQVARDKVFAMLIILAFNVFFWCYFEQAGSSFNFLAEKIIDRDIGLHGLFQVLAGEANFPVSWFQSVNSVAIIALAPVIAWIWVRMGKANPTIPRKFSFGLVFNALAFLLLMYSLTHLVASDTGKIPFWTLVMVYVIQSVGELCLSPIGLSMTTKLAPPKLTGFAMGAWFLSIAIGNNLAGIFAGEASGETGMTTASALDAYTKGFWILLVAGIILFLVSPLVNRLMHGTK
ncbi:MAG: MFS transporter [Proteobacteria bacterium]|uniref:peptide MFS transporter n=1 Tax=Rudaea sp. TaxID=2136325 RepID=UPI001D2FEC3D|nr:MFS transporter [Pseudomonadota bacterium]MBS0567919.1 MFS transporter [Pseudomonadota bacterium]